MISGIITFILAALSMMWINAIVVPVSKSLGMEWLAFPGMLMVVLGSGWAWYIISQWIERD